MKLKLVSWSVLLVITLSVRVTAQPQDTLAEKMLLYQRSYGGWPQYGGDPTNYRQPIDEPFHQKLLADKDRRDATIDDRSTTFEINYLLKAYQETGNDRYLHAAERGIAYLLRAQNAAGGWPQHYPDTSGYHRHITYNDNAMIDVLRIVKHAAKDVKPFQPVADSLKIQAAKALAAGVQCILRTQVVQNGVLTVWCAQHDSRTLRPAKARAFELPSLSGMESVEIVRFLMSIDQPSEEIQTAIRSAVRWLERVRIDGYDVQLISDPSQPTGRDRVLVEQPGSSVWARFYDLDTNEPIFVDRSSIRKATLTDIDNERRVGYAFYGKWAGKLLEKEYPGWEAKW